MKDARLLSPLRKRIYPNAMTGTHIGSAGPIVKATRQGAEPGQPDSVTWDCLERLGWTVYTGPAETDERGYIIPGTDPSI